MRFISLDNTAMAQTNLSLLFALNGVLQPWELRIKYTFERRPRQISFAADKAERLTSVGIVYLFLEGMLSAAGRLHPQCANNSWCCNASFTRRAY
jgi:hypothetical protein